MSEARVINDDVIAACQQLPKEQFSLIVTSPPYNIGKEYEARTDLDTYLEWQAEVISALTPLLTPNGSICWQVGSFVERGEVHPLDIAFYPLFTKLGFRLRNRIIWHFNHGMHAKKRFSGRYETVLWFTRSDTYTFNLDAVRVPSKYPGKLHYKGPKRGTPSGNPLGKNPSDFWEFLADEWDEGVWQIPNVKANHVEKTSHPCQFPFELVERCVLALTNEEEWVLDPFAGAGSSLVAALMHNRNAVGIERDASYCEISEQRLCNLRGGTLKTRPLGKSVHTPTGREKIAQRPVQWDTT